MVARLHFPEVEVAHRGCVVGGNPEGILSIWNPARFADDLTCSAVCVACGCTAASAQALRRNRRFLSGVT